VKKAVQFLNGPVSDVRGGADARRTLTTPWKNERIAAVVGGFRIGDVDQLTPELGLRCIILQYSGLA
jgi:hypothetical protein